MSELEILINAINEAVVAGKNYDIDDPDYLLSMLEELDKGLSKIEHEKIAQIRECIASQIKEWHGEHDESEDEFDED